MNETAVQGVVYSTHALVDETPSEALVLMCSDRRFQTAFHEFLSQHLHLGRWDSITTPGGAYMLSFAEVLPKQLKVGMRMLKFVMQASTPSRIIVINHEGCKRYLEAFHSQLNRLGFSLKDKQRRDLESVARDLRGAFPAATVEAYYASIGTGQTVEFERV
ncbi:MAG TPA: carbonic anhydrase [Dehalococcoidia bacterium]|nr:carbonic anhydrase [Dehalococcoidia bacterium]